MFSIQFDSLNAEHTWLVHQLMHKKVTINLIQDTKDLVDAAEDTKSEPKPTRAPRRADTIEQQAPVH